LSSERTYSTSEVSQMWNVSESTVKRWADHFGLRCCRTPGGHRRFRLEDISEFQTRRAFEATGILTTEDWEDPGLETWLNTKNFEKVRELLVYLAAQNQRTKTRSLLDRLYLRGMALESIYEDILVPVEGLLTPGVPIEELSLGQSMVARSNIEEALFHLSIKMIRRKPNGKTALCAAPVAAARLPVTVLGKIVEAEGWDALNLGDDVPLPVMSQMVETEPVNLVCLFAGNGIDPSQDGFSDLTRTARGYRIPVLAMVAGRSPSPRPEGVDVCFSDFRKLRKYVHKLGS